MMANCYCRLGLVYLGFSILASFIKLGHQPDIATFNTLMVSSMDVKTIDNLLGKALSLFSKMKTKGIPPDVVTYNTLIRGMCILGKRKDARQLFTKTLDNKYSLCFINLCFFTMHVNQGVIGLHNRKYVVVQHLRKQLTINDCVINDNIRHTMAMRLHLPKQIKSTYVIASSTEAFERSTVAYGDMEKPQRLVETKNYSNLEPDDGLGASVYNGLLLTNVLMLATFSKNGDEDEREMEV
ncbi:hypothetical protein RDABS01_037496 [Bienertia sinuspersici]